MALGSDAFIDLEYVHACPWDVLFGKSTKHHPWRVPSADSHDETAAGGDGLARLRGDHCGGFLSYCIRVGKDFNSHGSSPLQSLFAKTGNAASRPRRLKPTPTLGQQKL